MKYEATSVDATHNVDDPLYQNYEESRSRAIEARAIAVGIDGSRVILTLEVGESYVEWSDDADQTRELALALLDAAARASAVAR